MLNEGNRLQERAIAMETEILAIVNSKISESFS